MAELTGIPWPEVIEKAAQNPLGITALAILTIAFVIVTMFRERTSPKVKLIAVAMLLVSVCGLTLTVLLAKHDVQTKEVKSENGNAIPDAPKNVHADLFERMPLIIRRLSEYDLSSLPHDTNSAVPSKVLAKHTFTFKKFDSSQKELFHIASTSSDTPPYLKSDTHKVTVTPLGRSQDNRLNEYLFTFDIAEDPVGEESDLRFTTQFTDAFNLPEQLWAAIRVPAKTLEAILRLKFSKANPAQRIDYYVRETKAEERIELNQETLRTKTEKPEGKTGFTLVEWQIPRPKPDQRYCIGWSW